MEKLKNYLSNPYVILGLGILFMILGSVKWTFTLAPWIGLALMLNFTRRVKLWKTMVFGLLALFVSIFIGLYDVFPAPMPIFPIIVFIVTLKSLLPYLVDRLTQASERGFIGTLIFPAAYVGLEFYESFTGGPTWSSIANTQYQFQALQQIASVFGLWGISFLVYWFASLVNWMANAKWQWTEIRTGVGIASLVYLMVLTFGVTRIWVNSHEPGEMVKIAGVTLDNTNVMETLYKDEFGKTISISPETSQTSPLLQEANKAMVPFIENPFEDKYRNARRVMDENLNQLFSQSATLADRGARIVVWSEAIGLSFNRNEEAIIERGKQLARDKEIYLIMGLGVINPGPVDGKRLMLVNKTVTLTPEGGLANVYLKSNPVPFAEQEYGSDDIIPVIETPYGKISMVICYDADFNPFLKQTGEKGTDILLVPSADWKKSSRSGWANRTWGFERVKSELQKTNLIRRAI